MALWQLCGMDVSPRGPESGVQRNPRLQRRESPLPTRSNQMRRRSNWRCTTWSWRCRRPSTPTAVTRRSRPVASYGNLSKLSRSVLSDWSQFYASFLIKLLSLSQPRDKIVAVLKYSECHEDVWESILNLGTRRGWVLFTSRPLYPWGKSPFTHWIGGWVGPTAGLDAVSKKSHPYHPYRCWESNSCSSQQWLS
jgi:hypothetical protein